MVIQPGGAYLAASYFTALPLVILLVAWIARRMQGDRGLWGASRFGSWPLVVLLVAYFGVIWNWLFRDQFYKIEPVSGREWRLQYRMPDSTKTLDPREIAVVGAKDLASITGGTTGRIVIELADGTRFRSAQVGRHRIPQLLELLRGMTVDPADGR